MMMDLVGDTEGQPKLLNETFFKWQGEETGEGRKRRGHLTPWRSSSRPGCSACTSDSALGLGANLKLLQVYPSPDGVTL